MSLPRFYPIFDSAAWLERLVPLGLQMVQLRIKDRCEQHVRGEIQRAKEICAAYSCCLVINDYWRLAIEEGCDFVHLGQEDLETSDVEALRSANIRLGVSTHDKSELRRALELDPDYVALGPIYPTILKKMKWHEQGLERLTTWRDLIGGRPLVAIGGMTVSRAQGAFDAGANVVSAVTDITLNPDPEGQVRTWLEATK